MKISAKLLISFLAVAVLTLIVGIVGIMNLTSVNSQHKDLFIRYGNTQGIVGKANAEYLRSRMFLRDIIINAGSAETVRTASDNVGTALDNLGKRLSEYEVSASTKEQRDNLNVLKATVASYEQVLNPILQLALEGKTDEAIAGIRSSAAVDVTAAMDKTMADLVDFNQNEGEKAAATLENNVNSTVILLIGVVIVAVIVAAALGIIIARSISKPITTVVKAANKLAAGDTDIQLDIKGKDETAQLGNAFSEVVASLRRLIADVNMLSQSAVDGRLATRADASAHQGDYRRIVEGVNQTLDAIIEPINESSAVLNEMSQGNLSVNVTGNYKGDHAVIKNALNDTINTIKGYITEISEVLSKVADGNLNVGITNDYRGEFIVIKDSINHIVDSLNDVLSEINSAAEQVASGTHQVSSGSQALSQGATEQASAIEELSASVTEIASQTKQNAMDAGRANTISTETREHALTGNSQMSAMLSSMNEINQASANISRIIKVIDDIAFQTNLLALNAAVEAARAGQHGKGFAVVAEEVRNLAARSANAAKETTAMIEGSMQKAAEGTRIANETAQALNKIVEGVERASDLVNAIATASNEQATGVAQINRGIEQVSQVVQTNSATAEESAAASEELSGQATLLKDMVGRFTLKKAAAFTPYKAGTIAHDSYSSLALPKPKISLNSTDFGKY